jgi:glycosyltransferase involved in cell wall biosynthesis
VRVDEWPSVTAVVATRDRPILLRRAIRSILDQRYDGPVECVVVFDRSEPEDLADVAGGDGARVRSIVTVRNDRTPGLAGARNSGAAVASGELLAFCDDDDEWLPDKLRRQVGALRAAPGATVATSGIAVESGGRRTIRRPAGDRVSLEVLLRSRATEVHPSTIVVRRDAFFDRIGPVDEDMPGSYGEDYEWLLRAAAASPLVAVPDPLVIVHRHPTSFFADRWTTIADSIGYLIAAHPEVIADRRNRARLYGRLAFARAATNDPLGAARWAGRSLLAHPSEPRPWLALAVAMRVVSPATVQRWANRRGRGI